MEDPKGTYPSSAPRYEVVVPYSSEAVFCSINTDTQTAQYGSHQSGMPASVTPQQLQSALKATMTETESFRHAGPRPSSNPQSTSFALPPSYPQQPHTEGAILRESSIYQT